MGNYCQPKCAEPTTEVKFASEPEATLQAQIAPLFKVTSEPNPDMKEIGQPMGLVDSFGQYFTGSTIEREDVLDARRVDKKGQTYYVYEIASPLAISGSVITVPSPSQGLSPSSALSLRVMPNGSEPRTTSARSLIPSKYSLSACYSGTFFFSFALLS